MTDTITTDPIYFKDLLFEEPQQTLTRPIVYRIENLTIHNHGTLNLVYDGSLKLQSQTPTPALDSEVSSLVMQKTMRKSEIYFKNRFPVPVRSIWICHQYGDEKLEEQTWHDIRAGETTQDPLTVTFFTGYNSWRSNKWVLKFTMMDGTVFQSREKLCLLREIDEMSQGPLVFCVNDNFEFQINTRSGGDKAALWEKDDMFNTLAFVQVRNNFEDLKASQVNMTHAHSDEAVFRLDFGDLEPGQTSFAQPIYFLSGVTNSGVDKWNINMEVPNFILPINAETESQRFANNNKDHAWIVWERRVMKTMTISLEGRGIVFPETPNEIMEWKTPLGYNACCFVAVQNGFNQEIEHLSLIHQCHDEHRYEYVYPSVLKGQRSEIRVIEHSTGNSDIWSETWVICVTLKDGTYWSNMIGMKYVPRSEDAEVVTFKVDEESLSIDPSSLHGEGIPVPQSIMCQVETFDYVDSNDDWTDTQSIVSSDDM